MGRFLRLLALPGLAVASSALGCANLIGLSNLDSDASSGGSAGPDSGGTGSDSGGTSSDSGGTSSDSGGTSSGSGGTSSGSGGDAPGGADGQGGAPPDCSIDEFDDAELTRACWDTFNDSVLFGGEYFLDEEESVLDLRPVQGRSWFDGDSSFLLYREITGNFLVEVEVSVYGGATGESQPYVQHANGGLLAFPATQPLESIADTFTGYYAIKTGSIGSDFHLGFKGEYTLDDETSRSTFETPGALSGMSLRMCRYNSILWTAYRLAGESVWQGLHANGLSAGYDTSGSSDLPKLEDPMYVGLLAEIWDENAEPEDARMIYSHAAFSVPAELDDCKK